MMADQDLMIAALTLLGGAGVGAAVGGILAAAVKWTGGRLHLFVVGAMSAGAGLGFTYGGASHTPGYVGAAEARAVDLGLPSGGREEAVLKVLRAYYPGDYAGALLALKAGKDGRLSQAEMERAFDAAIRPVMARELPMANTDNTLDWLKLARREQRALMADPVACYRSMRGKGRHSTTARSAGLRDDEMRLTARLLTQTALAPEVSRLPIDVDDRLARVAGAALADLPAAERRAVLSLRGAPTQAQASAVCDLGIKVYDALLLAPDDEAALMFKGLAATGFQRAASRPYGYR